MMTITVKREGKEHPVFVVETVPEALDIVRRMLEEEIVGGIVVRQIGWSLSRAENVNGKAATAA